MPQSHDKRPYRVPRTRPFADEDYLPIEDHGLIGDGQTCALVARDGTIPWLCLPQFDSAPYLAGILDRNIGGTFSIAPRGLTGGEQEYLHDTAVLVTTLDCPDGTVQITDAMTLRSGADLAEIADASRRELIRVARVVTGTVELDVRLATRRRQLFGREGGMWTLTSPDHPDLTLRLRTSHDLTVAEDGSLGATISLRAGEAFSTTLVWSPDNSLSTRVDPASMIDQTAEVWRRWMTNVHYEGPARHLVRRSALTLKLLDHSTTGAIMAAATSSLPEHVGGVRNWDYRYTWVRDAAFSTYALRRIGLGSEADAFLNWTLTCAERDGKPSIMYTLDGGQPQEEIEDPDLEGWRGSAPVRWGNGAAGQTQHDVYGELLDVAFQWTRAGGKIDDHLWEILTELTESVIGVWRTPDHGIWEIRDSARPFTYSVALCHVAVDRALQIAEISGRTCPVERWKKAADEIHAELLERSWDEDADTFTEHLADENGTGHGGLDGSLLTLPLRRIIDFDDSRMVSTVDKVVERLDAGNGLLYRYLHDESSDGLPGKEGAFLLCSFWLVDNLTGQGRLDEAVALYESLCARANHLGLLSEEIDPADGSFLGNFPQAFSHIGIIASGHRLARALGVQS
ncbi:glycoside hydrolase family 15 protein [Rhodococcus sp. 14-2470-1a]|uniref:glycoside hydrolase family 15 protein n=1 Tax=Rhodococcus sp. 14-2470-1a TaxID=2023150 RepID=UPI000B9AB1C8|nr:glycoside hydrolase family 15 protein [Rhodococcus sp. 14-2470-1a]OZF41997.1 glycoside hydrolase family 15 [Rhodococcus sp. 14-2470-1a]